MRKVISASIAALLSLQIFSLNLVQAVENKEIAQPEKSTIAFKDIAGHWAESKIKALSEKGYVSGYDTEEGKVIKPDSNITRAEYLTVLLKTAKLKKVSDKVKEFSDVKEEDWFKETIDIASSNGVVSGYPDGSFGSNNPISRAEIAFILSKLNNWNKQTPSKVFSDVTEGEWYYDAVMTCKAKGIINGYPDGTFSPNAFATRAEAFTIVLNCLNTETIKNDIPAGSVSYGGGGGGKKSKNNTATPTPTQNSNITATPTPEQNKLGVPAAIYCADNKFLTNVAQGVSIEVYADAFNVKDQYGNKVNLKLNYKDVASSVYYYVYAKSEKEDIIEITDDVAYGNTQIIYTASETNVGSSVVKLSLIKDNDLDPNNGWLDGKSPDPSVVDFTYASVVDSCYMSVYSINKSPASFGIILSNLKKTMIKDESIESGVDTFTIEYEDTDPTDLETYYKSFDGTTSVYYYVYVKSNNTDKIKVLNNIAYGDKKIICKALKTDSESTTLTFLLIKDIDLNPNNGWLDGDMNTFADGNSALVEGPDKKAVDRFVLPLKVIRAAEK